MNAAGESQPDRAGTVAPVYQLEWEYPIWQLRFEETSGLIAAECRDADTLQTSFQVFNGKTGQVMLRNYKPTNAWWTGLAYIRARLLYLQGVSAKGVGRPAGITAVGIADGQVKWQRPEFSFYGLTASEMLVLPVAAESTELIGLNPDSGLETGLVGSIAEEQKRIASWQEHRIQSLAVPQHYPEESKYFLDLKEFIKSKTGYTAQFAIDYLEFKNIIALGFYPEQAEDKRTYRLAVFSLAGKIYLLENLGKELTGIGQDNFFIFQDTLILIKNRKTLLGFEV